MNSWMPADVRVADDFVDSNEGERATGTLGQVVYVSRDEAMRVVHIIAEREDELMRRLA
jgi:hypothetical protein